MKPSLIVVQRIKTAVPFILLLLPIVFFLISQHHQLLRGEFWQKNYDPSYIYFFNSLNILNGLDTPYIQHPGIPTHWFGAGVLKILHPFAGGVEITEKILSNPELHLRIMAMAFTVVAAFGIYILGYVAYRYSGRLWFALLAQCGPFLSAPGIIYGARVTAEPLIIFVSMLFACTMMYAVFSRSHNSKFYRAILMGLCGGFGVAIKMTFVPLVIGGSFLLIRSWRNMIAYFVIVAGAFFVFTLPAYSHYPRMFRWLKSLIISSGRYGKGEKTFLDPDKFIQNIVNLFHGYEFIFITIFVGVVIAFSIVTLRVFERVVLWKFKRHDGSSSYIWLFCGLFLIQVLQLLFVAKHPGTHYLVPGFVLSGLLLAVVVRLFLDLFSFNDPWHLIRIFRAGIALACVSLILVQAMSAVGNAQRGALRARKGIAKYEQVLQVLQKEFKECEMVYMGPSMAPSIAIHFGLNFISPHRKPYVKILNRLYGEKYLWNTKLQGWDHGKVVKMEPFLESSSCVVFRGVRKATFEDLPIWKTHSYERCDVGGDIVYVYGRSCRDTFLNAGIKLNTKPAPVR